MARNDGIETFTAKMPKAEADKLRRIADLNGIAPGGALGMMAVDLLRGRPQRLDGMRPEKGKAKARQAESSIPPAASPSGPETAPQDSI